MSELFLLRHREIPGLNQLKIYTANGGFETWMQTVKAQKPADVVQVVKDSGLQRARRGGFSHRHQVVLPAQ